MKKQQLLENRLFLAIFDTQQSKDDVIIDLIRIFLCLKLFILSQSNSVQNLSSLTLKTKELGRGVENMCRKLCTKFRAGTKAHSQNS